MLEVSQVSNMLQMTDCSPQRVAVLFGGKEILNLKVEEFGSLWLAHQIDQDIDLCDIVGGVVPRAERETVPFGR